MDLLAGVNHVAVLTADLDRFVEFYTEVFDLEVVFTETTPAFRHAIVRTGPTSWLHPAEVNGNDHGAASPAMFDRGHLDHLALTAASPATFHAIRDRLVARGPPTAPSKTWAPSTASGSTTRTACASSWWSSSTTPCRTSTPLAHWSRPETIA